ncbi:MAG: gliding motility-associated C-terminal domain-containing protein [Muribaculaceae bacterium]
MRKVLCVLLSCIAISISVMAAELSFDGLKLPVYKETPATSTGLDAVYVVNGAVGISASYKSSTGNQSVKWYRFSKLGGGYAEEITDISYNGDLTVLSKVEPDMGYIVEDGTQRSYYWIVDYSNCTLSLDAVTFSSDAECDMMMLDLAGTGADLAYYTINGQRKVLDRELTVSYSSLQWNEEGRVYESVQVDKSFESFKSSISVQVPLCNTTFYVSGDKYLRYWGEEVSAESDLYVTQAVEVKGYATQQNVTDDSQGTLGGSAPAIIDFEAYVTDAVVFKEWQIASDSEFEDVLFRYSEESIQYTFNEAGTFYVQFMGANADGTCSSTSEVFEVSIGESRLECPNAFSPLSDVDDSKVWRVTYKSIVEFKCHIFNRYGMEIFSFTDPSQCWDGKYKGKYVDAGVYFYVIQARGADGKNYKLKGDINIINLKDNK